jgi:hypothetical protein
VADGCSSFAAVVRPRFTPACAVADTKTIAAIKMNLRMFKSPVVEGELKSSGD